MPDVPFYAQDHAAHGVLPKILRAQAEALGDRPFLDICGQKASFAGMDNIAGRLAGGLRKLGLAQGDRIAMLLPNCLEFVGLWFAAAKLGAIEVPSNPELRGELLSHNLHTCGAQLLAADRAALPNIAEVQAQIPLVRTLIVVGATPQEARACGITINRIIAYEECLTAIEPVLPDVHLSDPMAILFTSGTTGPSKGVVMSHNHCFAWTEAMARNLGYTKDDSYFSPLPLFHTDAQMFGVYMPLIFGTRATLVERFSASRYWGQLRECGASATNLLGAMAVILARAPQTAARSENPVRVCQCIPMVPDKAAFEARFSMTLVTGYGQTETSFVTLDTAEQTRDGSCGRPHPDWEVAVVDAHDLPLPAGEVGEIVARAKQNWRLFSGYHGNPAKTVEATRNLWYHSGDAGYLDAEGWLYFMHRLSESIRRRGENISAYEVEIIAESHPDVVECAAFGVASEYTEEDLMLVVLRKPGSALEPTDLYEYFRRHAPRHMIPRYIEITGDLLPRTPTEKISRTALKQRGVSAHVFDGEKV